MAAVCSNPETREIMEGYFTLVQTVHKKTRDYQRLMADFQNLIEAFDKSRKLTQMEVERMVNMRLQLERSEQARRELQHKFDEKEREMRTMEAQLADARKMVGSRLGYIRALEADRDELESRMKLVKESLKTQLDVLPADSQHQLAFINEPKLYRSESREYAARERFALPRIESENEESIDYDDTSREQSRIEEADERTPVRSVKRPSLSASRRALFTAPHPPLIRGVGRMSSGVGRGIAKRKSSVGFAPKTPAVNTTTTVTSTVLMDNSTREVKQVKTTVAVNRKSCTPRRSNWTGGQPINNRQHRFEKYSGITKKCTICRTGFGFLRSNHLGLNCVDCSVYVHDKCKEKLSSCIPQSLTPRAHMAKSSRLPMTPLSSAKKAGPAGLRPPLHEFCLPTAPMLPVPVVRCVIALEQRSGKEKRMEKMEQEGLYRIPGHKARVARFLEGLCEMKEVPVHLHILEPEMITGCIKTFLNNLRDPLIPKTSRREFVLAATNADAEERESQLRKAIDDLPQPHRDTLAYLCVHWHKVIALSHLNKMTLENLASCLAPTVIGLNMDQDDRRSVSYLTSSTTMTAMQAAGDDVKNAIEVLTALLKMGTEYWSEFVSFDDLNRSINTLPSKTPLVKTTRDGWKR